MFTFAGYVYGYWLCLFTNNLGSECQTRSVRYPTDTPLASYNTRRRAVSDRLTNHNVAQVTVVVISVYNLWKHKYGSDLDVFNALAIFPASTSTNSDNQSNYDPWLVPGLSV
jgi:hypothetical protein